MKAIAKQLKHDFSKGDLKLYDSHGKLIYFEDSDEYWAKFERDSYGNTTYFENSDGYWQKQKFDRRGRETYVKNSNGYWSKSEYDSNGKTVTIDGVEYELKEKVGSR